jgi:hypothetical protein
VHRVAADPVASNAGTVKVVSLAGREASNLTGWGNLLLFQWTTRYEEYA